MDPETRDKVARLPVWARELIKKLQAEAEPNNSELRNMRQRVTNAEEKVRKMQERVDAMTHLMTCAAQGGHEVAAEYVRQVIDLHSTEAE